MNEPTTATHAKADATVERALSYAFRLILKMEQSCPGNQLIYEGDVVLWAIGQLNPSLLTVLDAAGALDEVRRCLALYDALRQSAEAFRYQGYLDGCAEMSVDYPDDGYLTVEDILYAIAQRSCPIANFPERAQLERIFRAIQEREHVAKSSGSARKRLPAVVHSYDIDDSLGSHMPYYDALQTQSYIVSAMLHARRELLLSDDGAEPNFWDKVYLSVVVDWLEMDLPDVAASILGAGEVSDYVRDLFAFRTEMQRVEQIWAGVSYPVRALLLRCPDEHEALEMVRRIVCARGVAEADVSRFASSVWSMIRRRDAANFDRTTRVHKCNETNAFVDQIRAMPAAFENCFMVDTHTLPVGVSALIAEKQALVVRLPELWLDRVDLLGKTTNLRPFFSEHVHSANDRRELALGSAFWCEYAQLQPVLFGFRRAIPIVYVFNGSLVICQHDFHHFSDLRYMVDLSPKRYRIVSVREDGAVLFDTWLGWSECHPSMIANVVNEASYRNVGTLSKAYRAETASAAK